MAVERKLITGNIQEMVLCRMIRPRAYRTLESCKACEYHVGLDQISKAQGDFPAQFCVTCGLPAQVEVSNLIKEV